MFERSHARRRRGATRRSHSHSRAAAPAVKLRALLLLLLLAAVLAGAWALRPKLERDVMRFEHVRIDGEFSSLSPSRVEEVIRNHLDGDYFTQDLEVIRQALLELPWVEQASVRRRWPSGLDVAIAERQAVAYWGDAGLLSDRGVVFTPRQRDPELGLPSLRGPEGLHAAVWQFYADMRMHLQASGIVVTSVLLDDRRSWQVTLDKGLKIKLGRTDIASRLRRLYQVFAMRDAVGMKSMVHIDMRYPNGFAVLHRESGADAAAGGRNAYGDTVSAFNNSMDGNADTRVSEV